MVNDSHPVRLRYSKTLKVILFKSNFAMAAGTGQGYHSTQYHKDKNYYMLHVEHMTLEYALMQCVYHEL